MLPFALEQPVAIRAPVPIMVSMEEVDTLNATILQLRKEKEDRKENFHQVTCERNYLRRDLDQAVEQLKRSDIMIRVEEDKKE